MLKQYNNIIIVMYFFFKMHVICLRGLPLITDASRGGVGGSTLMHTNAYKGGGGFEHDKKYAFCTQVQLLPIFSHEMKNKFLVKNLRNVYLHMNVFDPCYKCHIYH